MAYTPQHCNEYPHFRKFKDPLLNALVLTIPITKMLHKRL